MMPEDDKIHIHIDPSEIDPSLPGVDADGRCAVYGGETDVSFGLAGGGYGAYTYCIECGVILEKTEAID